MVYVYGTYGTIEVFPKLHLLMGQLGVSLTNSYLGIKEAYFHGHKIDILMLTDYDSVCTRRST